MDKRFSRQIVLSEIGKEGQKKLTEKTIAIVGIGALGTVSSELLVRAGINKLILIDRDIIEESNLQRQLLFEENDINRPKVKVAKEKLLKINSKNSIETHFINLDYSKLNILEKADLILDGTDNLMTRFLINDYCKKNKKPWIYGAAIGTKGYALPLLPDGPCLRCFLAEADLDTCTSTGVLNSITTSIAALQVSLTIKILLNKNVPSTLYSYDIWQPNFKPLSIKKKENCSCCSGKYEYLTNKKETKSIHFCGSKKYLINGKKKDLTKLAEKLSKTQKIQINKKALIIDNITLFADGRALVKANSEKEALSSYSKYIGN